MTRGDLSPRVVGLHRICIALKPYQSPNARARAKGSSVYKCPVDFEGNPVAHGAEPAQSSRESVMPVVDTAAPVDWAYSSRFESRLLVAVAVMAGATRTVVGTAFRCGQRPKGQVSDPRMERRLATTVQEQGNNRSSNDLVPWQGLLTVTVCRELG